MNGSNGQAPATAPAQLPLDLPQPAVSSPARNDTPAPLTAARLAALVLLSLLAVGASVTAFAESYHGLWLWAVHHGVTGGWARAWPVQVDVFVGAPELVLFVALVDGWRTRDRVLCWLVAAAGLAVSVAGNAGHVHGALDRLTNAVPPLAAAACLAFGLAVLKRIMAARTTPGVPGAGYARELEQRAARLYRAQLDNGNVPGIRTLKRDLGVGQARAQQVRRHLRTLARRWLSTPRVDDTPGHRPGRFRCYPHPATLRRRRAGPAPAIVARFAARCAIRATVSGPHLNKAGRLYRAGGPPAEGRRSAGDRCAIRGTLRDSLLNRPDRADRNY